MRACFRLLLKLAVLSLPLNFFLATYVWYDPFRVLYHYDDYYQGHDVGLDRDFVSTEVFLRQVDRYHYDSFIFGNSRTMAFLTSDWSPLIGSPVAFHFDASMESLFGIVGKVRLVEQKGLPLRNALILLDVSILAGTTDRYDEHLYVKHPAVSGNGWLPFQLAFVKSYLSPKFCLPFLAKKLLGRQIPGFPSPFRAEVPEQMDPVTNDIRVPKLEQRIAADPEAYYRGWDAKYPPDQKDSKTSPPVICDAAKELLGDLREAFARQGTNYRIVINPLWNKRQLHPADLGVLKSIFGKDRVFDFSGVNHITSDKLNYYEDSHYRPHIGREILSRIYHCPD